MHTCIQGTCRSAPPGRHLIRSAIRASAGRGCVLRGGWSALFVLRSSCPVASSAASRPRLDGMLSLTYRYSTGKRRGKETINQANASTCIQCVHQVTLIFLRPALHACASPRLVACGKPLHAQEDEQPQRDLFRAWMAQSRAMNRGSSASEPHPTKHSNVPKPSQAAGCSRSHVAALSLLAPVQSSIEALATIE